MINQQISKDININQFIGKQYQNNSVPSSSSHSQKISNNKQILPSYTEIHVTSPSAAGIPVLEVVKRLEEEKLITKEDRMGLQDALYSSDVVRREEIVKSLCDVELSMNSRFAIRRLKAVIHQNGGGEISSRYRNSMSSIGDDSSRIMNANAVGLVPPLVLKIGSSKSNSSKNIKPTNSSLETSTISPPKESSASARLSNEINNSQGTNHYFVGAGNKLYIDPGIIKGSNSNNQQISNITTGNKISIVNSTIEHQSGMQIKVSTRSGANSVSYGTANNNVNNSSKPSPTIVDYTSAVNNNPLLLSDNSGKQQQQQSKFKYYNSIEPMKLIVATQSGNDDDLLLENMNTQNAIHQVVGKAPLYSAPGDNFNVLSKISIRLQAFYDKYDASKMGPRRFAVLVGGGSYNPLTRMHLRTYFLAKQVYFIVIIIAIYTI